MIYPLTLDDVENATDEEILAAYALNGWNEGAARWCLMAIRGTIPPGLNFD